MCTEAVTERSQPRREGPRTGSSVNPDPPNVSYRLHHRVDHGAIAFDGVVAVVKGGGLKRAENGRYANPETVSLLNIPYVLWPLRFRARDCYRSRANDCAVRRS